MVYGIVQLINFAHGEIFMIGGFGALTAYLVLPDRHLPPGGHTPHDRRRRTRLRRRRHRQPNASPTGPCAARPRLAPLITAIGLSIALQQLVWRSTPTPRRPQLPRVQGRRLQDLDNRHHPARRRLRPRPRPAVHARPRPLRLQEPQRPRHAGHRAGPRHREADGHQHRPHHRHGLRHRCRVRRRRRRRLRPRQGPDQLRDGLHPRPQGLHRSRPRRHRQHLRSHGRRRRPRPRRSPLIAYIEDIPGMQQLGGGAWSNVWAFVLLIVVLLVGHKACSASASRIGRENHDHQHHHADRRGHAPPAAQPRRPRGSSPRQPPHHRQHLPRLDVDRRVPRRPHLYGYPGGLQFLTLVGGALTLALRALRARHQGPALAHPRRLPKASGSWPSAPSAPPGSRVSPSPSTSAASSTSNPAPTSPPSARSSPLLAPAYSC